MKHSQICPKCGSADVAFVRGTVGIYGTGNNIMTGTSTFSAVPVHRYVCCSCGYAEEWISEEDLKKIKKKYQ